MRRVVEVLPEKTELESLGLQKRDFQVHPEIYRHYAAKFRRDLAEFARKHREGGGQAVEDPVLSGAAADEAWLTAFEQSLPPYHYFRGGIYRYRIDRRGDSERPIILESIERDEITGVPGVDGYTSEHSLFVLLVRRIEKWLTRHDKG